MYHYLFIFTVLFALSGALSAAKFDNSYNHHRRGTVTRLKVCGERCSGTNYLLYLLHKNFPALEETGLNEFGHKHFLWWFGTRFKNKTLKKLKYTPDDVLLTNSENCLFVVVVRDPYDWLRSFYLKPYDVTSKLCKRGFYHFVKNKWELTKTYEGADGQHNEVDNYNPWTGKPFRNVLELRKHKILNYQILSQLVDNYLFVRYEDVQGDPQGFIEYVAQVFGLTKNEQYVPIDTVIDSRIPPTQTITQAMRPFEKNPYFPIKPHVLKYINNQIDWELEHEIGYSLKTAVE